MKITRRATLKTTTLAATALLHLIILATLLPCAAQGQAAQNQSDKIASYIARVKQGDLTPSLIEEIAKAGALQAVPVLKEQFVHTQDVDSKDKIASALVRLGDKDTTYWDFVVEQAARAVESDVPVPTWDAQGKKMNGQFSPEIVAWAKAHNVSADSAAEDALYELPGKVLLLGQIGDPRAVPLLQRALQSPNYLIEIAAADGLAQIQDKNSIPLIIEACRKAPPDAATTIAESLVFFDDSQAQNAVDTYMPKESAKAAREARANGKKPIGD